MVDINEHIIERRGVVLALRTILGSLIRKFGPGLPKKGRRRVLKAVVKGEKDPYASLATHLERGTSKDIWAVVIDATGADPPALPSSSEELNDLNNVCNDLGLPRMFRANAEALASLDARSRGALVRSFEVKDAVFHLGPGDRLRDPEHLRRTVRRLNTDLIVRGKRLTPHMNTHYRHNSFVMTVVAAGSFPEGEIEALSEVLGELKIGKFKVKGKNGEVTQGFRRYLERTGKDCAEDVKYGGKEQGELKEERLEL